MAARRHPFSTLLVALLVWLTGVSTASAPRAQERRLMVAGDDAISAVSLAVPRSTIAVARDVQRTPALPDNAPAILPSTAAPPAPSERARGEFDTQSRARRAQRIASTYDAMAPPVIVMAAHIG